MKTSLSIIGTCVSNLIFRVAANSGICEFLLKGATTLINPLSLGDSTNMNILDILDECKGAPSQMHVVSWKFQLGKNFQDICKGKYILIDLITAPSSLYKIENVEKSFYLSKKPLFDHECNRKLLYQWCENNGFSIKEIENPLFELEKDEIKILIENFADNIKSFYDNEHIILVEAPYGIDTLLEDGCIERIYEIEQTNKINEMIKFCESVFIKRVNCLFIIKNFEDVLLLSSDRRLHVTGKSQTHYDEMFYIYGYKALDIITDTESIEDRLGRLKELYKSYFEQFKRRKEIAIHATCEKLTKMKSLAGEQYDDWNEFSKSRDSYLDFIRKKYCIINHYFIPLIYCENLNDYIEELLTIKENYYLLFSIRDTADKYWNRWMNKDKINISVDLSVKRGMSYCGVFDLFNLETKEVFGGSSDEQTMLFEHNCLKALIISKGKVKDGESVYSKILINNINYSMNRLGANFVLYSEKENAVIDSFFVNFCRDENLRIHRR